MGPFVIRTSFVTLGSGHPIGDCRSEASSSRSGAARGSRSSDDQSSHRKVRVSALGHCDGRPKRLAIWAAVLLTGWGLLALRPVLVGLTLELVQSGVVVGEFVEMSEGNLGCHQWIVARHIGGRVRGTVLEFDVHAFEEL